MLKTVGVGLISLCAVGAAAQHAPVCDVTCAPDPASTTYTPINRTRTEPENQRDQLGSESYSYAIPILHLPGRAGLDLNLTLYYNSRVWTVDTANSRIALNADQDSPSYGFRLGFGFLELVDGDYIVTLHDGAKHKLKAVSGTTYYDSTDSSYLRYNNSNRKLHFKNGKWILYELISGTDYLRPTKISDTNGNYISITYVANKNFDINVITDTLGRQITFNYTSGKLTTITQNTSPTATTHATFTWGTGQLKYSFSGISTVDTLAANSEVNVLKSCTYPNDTGYRFNYDLSNDGHVHLAIVNKIERFGAGASHPVQMSITYNYPTGSTAQSGHPTFTQQVVYDGVNSGTWTHARSKSNGMVSSYTITDPTGASTVTALSTANDWKDGLVTSVTVKDTAGSNFRVMANTWTADATTNNNPRVSSTTTTWSDKATSNVSKVEYGYDTYGNVTSLKEYDFGETLKRETVTEYSSDTSLTDAHIWDRPISVKVKDASGTVYSRTGFTYDNTVTPVTGAANHDDTFTGTRANLVTITRYPHATDSTGELPRQLTYDSLGNLTSADVDCCNKKTWVYSSTYQYAYPTTETQGPALGPQLSTEATYNFASGLMATSENENEKVTTYTYDAMRRITNIELPNGVDIITVYGDDVAKPTVKESNSINNAVTFKEFDGAGRLLRQELRDGTTLVSLTTSEYDGAGRLLRTSNPRASVSETVKWTEFEYDTAGRQKKATPPGSAGHYAYDYSGEKLTITDPASKKRRQYSDALGRLAQVDEPGGTSAGSQGTGSVTISGSLRSTVVGATSAVSATGSVTISGSAQSTPNPDVICPGSNPNCSLIWDTGSVSVTVNGMTKSATYTGSSTPTTLGNTIRNAFNNDGARTVNAGGSGGTITFTAITAGTGGNSYALSSSSTTNLPEYFSPSFSGTPSGSTLTGGANANPGTTVYDSGTVTLTVSGQTKSVSFSSSVNTTATAIASALATAMNGDGAFPMTGSASGATINLTARAISAATLTVTPGATWNTTHWGTAGFSSSTGSVSGGSDAHGSVIEYPYQTAYSYDPLDRLTSVKDVISGTPTQQRTYAYDLLGRLTSVTTPESGTVTYAYVANGVCSLNSHFKPAKRTDARGVETKYCYDGLHRLTSVQYSDGTPTISYTYGASVASNNNGRLWKVTDALGTDSEVLTYDSMGRVTDVDKIVSSVTYNTHYGYNDLGQVTSMRYPSASSVSQSYDNLGRLNSIASGGTTYLSIASSAYTAAGLPTAATYGNGTNGVFEYNDRLQVARIKYQQSGTDLMNLVYGYGTSNNGQIQSVDSYNASGVVDPAKSVSYQYDEWARLKQAETGNLTSPDTFRIAWTYDRYGNRLSQTSTGGTLSVTNTTVTVAAATNRITTSGFTYDSAGNLTNDGVHTYVYDAENRIKTLDGASANATYDAAGLRVKKGSTVYIFAGSKVIAEYASGTAATSPSKEYVYSGSQLLVTKTSSTTTYAYNDHLSARMERDSTGASVRSFGHLPFGDAWYETGTASKWKFTSYERDTDSATDYAIFRQSSWKLGRFLQGDPLQGTLADPQSLNRYAYVRNNPSNFIDSLGLEYSGPIYVPDTGTPVITVSVWAQAPTTPSISGGGGTSGAGGAGLGVGSLAPFLDGGEGGGGGGGGGTRPKKPSGAQIIQQLQWQALQECIKELYNINLRTFVPVAPGSNGYFYGLDSSGQGITVETDVTHSSWSLGLTILPLGGPVAGKAPLSTARSQTNYVAKDYLVMAPNLIQPTQIHELAHSLDLITSGSIFGSSETSANRLLDCINGKRQ